MTSYVTRAQADRGRKLLELVNDPSWTPPKENHPVSNRIHAPFDDDTRAALRAWQDCPWAHPLTCGTCNSSLPLIPEKRGLVCPACFAVQDSVPALCSTLPDNPAAILAANAKAPDETD